MIALVLYACVISASGQPLPGQCDTVILTGKPYASMTDCRLDRLKARDQWMKQDGRYAVYADCKVLGGDLPK